MRIFLKLYTRYLQLQRRFSGKKERMEFAPGTYVGENRVMIRLWSILGPTTNRTLLIVCALFARLDLFLWIVVVAGNMWLLACYLLQRRVHHRPGQVS